MPDHLTAAQWEAFKGPSTPGPGAGFRLVGTLVKGVTEHDITDDIESWGQTRIALVNWDELSGSEAIPWPLLVWTVRNDDGSYTPGHANSIWSPDRPQEYQAHFEVYESVSVPGTETKIVDFTFDVDLVELVGFRAIVTSVHPLRRYWLKQWSREDHRHAMDWNGASHQVTL